LIGAAGRAPRPGMLDLAINSAGRSLDDVDFDLRHALGGDAQGFGGRGGDVDHAAVNEWAAVVHPNRHRFACVDIGDAQPRAERQGAMRRGQFALVELFAARRMRVIAVEAREPIGRAAIAGDGLLFGLVRRRHPVPRDHFPAGLQRRLAAGAGHHRRLLRAGGKHGRGQRSEEEPQRSRHRRLAFGADTRARRRADG